MPLSFGMTAQPKCPKIIKDWILKSFLQPFAVKYSHMKFLMPLADSTVQTPGKLKHFWAWKELGFEVPFLPLALLCTSGEAEFHCWTITDPGCLGLGYNSEQPTYSWSYPTPIYFLPRISMVTPLWAYIWGKMAKEVVGGCISLFELFQ